MTPRVSVIIATRRPPGWAALDRAVRSVLRQTWADLDVWVVDDGSDPPARLAPEVAADPRVHLLRLGGNVGTGAARNLGVERSAGEMLAFLDDDDYWLPEKTARQLAVLSARGAWAGGATCAVRLRRGKEPWRTVMPPTESELPTRLLRECRVAPSTVMLRRSAFDAVGGFDPSLRRVEDWDLWLRLSDRYGWACMEEVLAVREVSELPPDVSLHFAELMAQRLAGRIAGLPPPDRRRAEAHHLAQRGTYLALGGERRDARRALWRAWRTCPRSPRPLVQIVRTWVGEAAWQTARRWRDRVRLLRPRSSQEPTVAPPAP